MKSTPRPSPQEFGEAWDLLRGPAVAHRGLWSPGGAPENSLGAFQAAVHAGYGIELDVWLSADGEAMVFHDLELERLTGESGKITERMAHDLSRLALSGTDETIPTLAEVLVETGHHTLIQIELKTPFGQVGPLEKRVSEVLLDHRGPVAIIGFNPYSHAWFADHHPQIMRGLDSYQWNDAAAAKLAPESRQAYARLEHVALARPDFLALHAEMLPCPEAEIRRSQQGMPVIAWTVRSQAQWDQIEPHCDNIIFEGFRPCQTTV